jgi:DNA-binding GntR family transcriptional regulator
MTKREHAYRQLRSHLLHRQLRPGERLLEIPLAAKLGVSRIPLREAIDQLVSEGLVERTPGLGSLVRSATPEALREIYEMREVLECFTVEKAARGMNAAHLGRLDDLCGEMSAGLAEYRRTKKWTPSIRERLVSADVAFHQTIASAANNEHVEKEIQRLQAISELLSYRPEIAKDELKAMTRSAAEHLGILQALRRSDGQSAQARISEHIRRACRRALLVLEAATGSEDRLEPHSVGKFLGLVTNSAN